MAIYMNWDGVKGDATSAGHKDWIVLSSVQWGVGRGISQRTGSMEGREAGVPSVSEIVVTKEMDAASGPAWQQALIGQEGKTVRIDFVSTSKGSENIFMFMELTNTLCSGHSFSSGGGRPSESVSLNCTKIEVKYMEQGSTGSNATGGSGIIYNIADAQTG